MKIRHGLTVSMLLLLGGSPLWANPIPSRTIRYSLEAANVASTDIGMTEPLDFTIDAGDVPWVRVRFGRTTLPDGAHIELTSELDGAVQTLTASQLADWKYGSAYFNGSRVRLRVVAPRGSTDASVEVRSLEVGEWPWNLPQESQCGATDDRVLSSEPERARLMIVGCTASIVNEAGCMITAGHCLNDNAFVAEFNVPPSTAGGTIVHPPPSDQYTVETASFQSSNAGGGSDWGVFRCLPNTQTGLTPFEAQGAHLTVAANIPSFPVNIEIVGYGIDSGVRNQVQQTATGAASGTAAGPAGTIIEYQVDTEPGNSGSAVTRVDTGEVIAIHTNGGCESNGTGANFGTPVDNAALQAALVSVCSGVTEPVGCDDVLRLTTRCRNGRIRANVVMTDSSHSGATVTIEVDGVPHELTIAGSRATYSAAASAGSHTVELVVPDGCFPLRNVTCN